MRALLVAVPGVQEAEVDFENSLAVVRYDDTETDLASLVQAVIAGGYKSWSTDTEKK